MKNLIVLLGLLQLSVVSASGQPAQTHIAKSIRDKTFSKAIRQAETYVDSLRMHQAIPGLSVCVGTPTRMLWAQGFGYADLEAQVPVTINTKFRLGSVSKSVTSLALGRLVEDQQLDLDQPIQRYVPTFPLKKYPITARQLATHTAGIRHYRDSDPIACPKRYTTVQEGLFLFSQDSLLFRPGTAYGYSTYGYSLLSAVIEGASQSTYLDYMQQAIFAPLGMTSTSADYSDRIVINRVRFYEHQGNQLVNAAQIDNSYKWAGGGLVSTPTDLVKLGGELIRPTLLRPKTVALLLTPQQLLDGTDTHYGLGWRLGVDAQARPIIHHGGLIDGGRAFLLLYPSHNLVVAITANMSGVTINLPEVETIAHYFLQAMR